LFIRDAGRGAGIAPVSDVAADFVNGCGEVTAGAVDMGVGLPIGAGKGTAEFTSFVAETSSDAVMAIGREISTGLSLAARPEEITNMAVRVWKTGIRGTLTWLWNVAYGMIVGDILGLGV
jgi:hypothetical protein